MSLIKQAITIQSVTKAKVMQLLGVTELEYNTYLHDQGIAYLEAQLGYNSLFKSLSESALFWKWWRNQWHAIEAEFVDEAANMDANERRIWYYEVVHCLKQFAYTPHKSILIDAIKNCNNPVKHQL